MVIKVVFDYVSVFVERAKVKSWYIWIINGVIPIQDLRGEG